MIPLNLKLGLTAIVVALGAWFIYVKFKPVAPPPKLAEKQKLDQKKKQLQTKKTFDPTTGKLLSEVVTDTDTDTHKASEVKYQPIEQDNFMIEAGTPINKFGDELSSVGVKYRPIDNIPLVNKTWLGLEYQPQHKEILFKASWSTRLNL